jgi:NAD(P)-dependent dehydrogenase (short-subunit alcohol dehydrogenase family)
VAIADLSGAEVVADEIAVAGGEALAITASVSDPEAVEAMAARVLERWGRIDILVNNAGILRDRSFTKMTLDEWRAVIDVHLTGAFLCTKAVWEPMRTAGYGRVVMTTSSSGLYGNFGQANYGAAKMGLVGLMQTLAIEGAKHDIRVNCLAPTASTQMTQGLLPEAVLARLGPEAVTPALLHLVSEAAPSRAIVCAGAGSFERSYVTLTPGVHLGLGEGVPEALAAAFDQVSEREGEIVPENGATQGAVEVTKAIQAGEG